MSTLPWDNLFYSLLLIVGGAGIGLAGMGIFLHFRMLALDPRQKARHNASIVLKAGVGLSSAVLLFAIVRQGHTPSTPTGWAFLAATAIQAVGLAWFAKLDIVKYAIMDTVRHNGHSAGAVLDRIQSEHDVLEARVSAEEKRNTDIEVAAAHLEAEVDVHAAEEGGHHEGVK
jgi:BMFP domain-containing protein YqiC